MNVNETNGMFEIEEKLGKCNPRLRMVLITVILKVIDRFGKQNAKKKIKGILVIPKEIYKVHQEGVFVPTSTNFLN